MKKAILTRAIYIFLVLLLSANSYLAVSNWQARNNLGIPIPVTVAVYEDSLQASVSSSASSLTLVRGTDKAGNNLSGRVSAVIDEGTASEEFMIVTCTGTSCTINSRGLDPVNPITEDSDLKFSHRRGSSFKITDYPQLAILSRLLNGDENFPNQIYYDSSVSVSSTTALANKDYVDGVVNQGAATSTESLGGIVELATALETASSTDLGADIPLVLQAKNATDTPSTTGCAAGYTTIAGAGCTIIASLLGKIKQAWLDLTAAFTWTGAHIFNGGLTANTATTTTLVVGSSNPTASHTTGGLWFPSATSTVSIDTPQICFSGADCVTNGDGGWQQLGETTFSTGSATTTVAARQDLMVHVFTTSNTITSKVTMQLNEDGGTNYAEDLILDNADDAGTAVNTSATRWTLLDDTATTAVSCVVHIVNRTASVKVGTWHCVKVGATAATGPVTMEGFGTWHNTSDAITEISIGSSSNGTFGAGSRMTIYGKKD